MTAHETTDSVAAALGASRVVDVGRGIGGPLDLLALRSEVSSRLRSSGGRPTDPDWTIARQVPFKQESWDRLRDLAAEVGTSQRRVGAAQLAAILVEHGLEEVETARWKEIFDASRDAPLLSASEAANVAGISFRQLEAWRKEGLVIPARVQERRRWYTIDTAVRMLWLRAVSDAAPEARSHQHEIATADVSARYLIVTLSGCPTAVSTSGELLRTLADEGSLSILDQLPLRLRLLGTDDHREEGRRGEAEAV